MPFKAPTTSKATSLSTQWQVRKVWTYFHRDVAEELKRHDKLLERTQAPLHLRTEQYGGMDIVSRFESAVYPIVMHPLEVVTAGVTALADAVAAIAITTSVALARQKERRRRFCSQ
jgi:hypothetical protein